MSGGEQLLNSGIIGITLAKVDDVKCLHAHVGDHIVRSENSIGKWALDELQKKGVDPGGCDGMFSINALSSLSVRS
jgi:hypothetical protein